MGKRPRLNQTEKIQNTIEDPLEYKANNCSPKARKSATITKELLYELWYDQHYIIRNQLGDDKGKRHGISPEKVDDLVNRLIPHMLYYSYKVKGFHFLNHQDNQKTRIIFKESSSEETLNVAIEIHFLTINSFEITIKTAMCVNDFRLSAGQYNINLLNNYSSVLYRFENQQNTEIATLEF